MKIENAFRMLENKLRILKELNVALPYAAHIVTACCALHNFCIDTGDIDNRISKTMKTTTTMSY